MAVVLFGGSIRANGSLAGVGSRGQGGYVETLRLSGTGLLLSGCNASNPGKSRVNATSVLLTEASWILATDGNRLFGEIRLVQGLLNLTILYRAVASEDEGSFLSLPGPLIHLGNVSRPQSP
jgi:hypothetical protein